MTEQPVEQTPPISQSEVAFRLRLAAYIAAQAAVTSGVLALINRAWRQMRDPYNPGQVRSYSQQVADIVRRGQLKSINLASGQQRLLLGDQGITIGRVTPSLPSQPRGVDPIDVAQRAAKESRLITSGAEVRQRVAEEMSLFTTSPEVEDALREMAYNQGLTRAMVMATDDLNLARREGYVQQFDKAPETVLGYRRVVHPELSKTGTCGLCMAASDRLYSRKELLPVHARCECTVSPVIEGREDVGKLLNKADFAALYKLAGNSTATRQVRENKKLVTKKVTVGGTSRESLTKVRYKIDQHGELGPYLRPRSKGADDPAARIAGIDQTLAGLGVWGEKRGDNVDLAAARNRQLDHRLDESKRASTT